MNRRATLDIINFITGLLIIAGGVMVIFNYVNLGLLVTIIGTLFKALEVVLRSRVK